MNKLFSKIATFALGAFMAIGVGVAVGNNDSVTDVYGAEDTTITFALGANGSASHLDGSSKTSYSETVSGYTLNITGGTNMYTGARDAMGNSCIKLGASSKAGSFNFTVPSAVTSVSLHVGKYKANTTKISVNGGATQTLTKNSNDGQYDVFTVDTSSNKTITFTTMSGGYRAMLNTVEFIVAASATPDPLDTPVPVYNEAAGTITWENISNAISYQVKVDNGAYTTGSSPYDVSGLTPGEEHTVYVKAIGDGTNYVESEAGQVTFTINAPEKEISIFKFIDPETSVNGSGQTEISYTVFYQLKFTDNSYGEASVSWGDKEVAFEHYVPEDDDGGFIEAVFKDNGSYVLTLSYEETNISLTINVSGLVKPAMVEISDLLTRETTGITGTSYSDWDTGVSSDAYYKGQSAGGNDSIQLRTTNSNSGIVTTQSGGKLKSITVVWNTSTSSGRTLDVYGKNEAYSAATDLYDNSTRGTKLGSIVYGTSTSLTIEGDYTYLGLRSNNGAMYITSITVTWETEGSSAPVTNLVKKIEINTANAKTTYYEGESFDLTTISVEGFDSNEEPIELTKSYLTVSYSPDTFTYDDETVTITAKYDDINADEPVTAETSIGVTIQRDVIQTLSWGSKGYTADSYFLEGKTLGECIKTSEWSFTPNYASGLKKEPPVFGVGEDDVHIGIYEDQNPENESDALKTKLTNEYQFTKEDNGKYLVAWYKGISSKGNISIRVVEAIKQEINGYIEVANGYSMVTDASTLESGDQVIIVAQSDDKTYALSTTQNNNNISATEIELNQEGNYDALADNVEYFTLSNGTAEGSFAFGTSANQYLHAVSSSSNYLRKKDKIEDNSSFSVLIDSSTGIATVRDCSDITRDWILFNPNSGSPIFSCYKEQGTGMTGIFIYKASTSSEIDNIANTELKAQFKLMEFANTFNSQLASICDSVNGNTDIETLKSTWDKLATAYDKIYTDLTDEEIEYIKTILSNAVYAQGNTQDSLETMLEKYDYIFGKYGSELENDFLANDTDRENAILFAKPDGIVSINAGDFSPTLIIVVSLSLLTFVCAFACAKKRKEQ